MRSKYLTPTGEQDIRNIVAYIQRDNLSAATRYYQRALDTFFELPDELLPKRASEALPEHVRELPVKGFTGYTLRVAVFESETYLVAAYAPGLSDDFKDARTLLGLREV